MKAPRALLLLALACATGDDARAGENRRWVAELELEGPLTRVVCDLGALGRCLWEEPLAEGERSTSRIPLPLSLSSGLSQLELAPEPQVTVEPAGDGRARFLGWTREQPGEPFLSRRGLGDRPRAPAPRAGAEPGAAALALALAGLVLALAWSRRPARALVAGVLAAALCAGLVLRAGGPPGLRRVVEGSMTQATWIEVTSSRGTLVGEFERVEVRPAGRALEYTLSGGETVRCAGATLFGLRRRPSLAGDWPELAQVWTRTAAGAWEVRGPWARGAPLPAVRPAGERAPGWLGAGLPQGVGILLGRMAGPRDRWLRVVGFPERD